MAKTINQDQTSSDQERGRQKDRKKQAKREAKVMLAIEKAKASIEKAQRKLARAKERLDARTARLHSLENKLSDVRASSAHDQAQDSSSQYGLNGQSGQGANEQTTTATAMPATAADLLGTQTHVMSEGSAGGATEPASSVDTPIPTDQEVSLPPAEGRADILPEDQATGTQPSASDSTESSNSSLSTDGEPENSYPMPQEQHEDETASSTEESDTSTSMESEYESSPPMPEEQHEDEATSAWESSQGEPSQEETY
ncbi:MAG TPA: hypothetical protein VFA09_17620 [Ktedonobacteraceae bacterium]|nr:hypothetical protein [Ktedonobacteraceae bacterium]